MVRLRIEEITDPKLKAAKDGELHNLKFRCTQIWRKIVGDMNESQKYDLLKCEMGKRGLKIHSNTPLDVALYKKAMLGIEVSSLGDLAVTPDYVSIGGGFVKSPKDAEDIDIIIREDESNRDEGLELKISRLIKKQTGKKSHFVYSKSGPHSDYIPTFDRILRAKDETKRIRVKEDYGKADKKKTEKPLPALEDYENLLHHIHISDKGKEEIHHCLIFDHIANMFKQIHLWVKDGKVYLDGKEIKEGTFHVIGGLEPTQGVVWSDKEAEDNGIHPKAMKQGMSLKEKSKEW